MYHNAQHNEGKPPRNNQAPVPTSQPTCDGSGGLKGAATKSKHGATRFPLRMNEVGSGPMGEREHEVT